MAFLSSGKIGLDFMGLGCGTEKVNLDWDYQTRQFWKFLDFPH